MAILDPSLCYGGAQAPTAVYSADASREVFGGAAYRFPRWWDSSGNGRYFSGGGTDDTNPRVNTTIGPWSRRVIRFAPSGAYTPYMISNTAASSMLGASGAMISFALYLNTVTTNSATGNNNEGIICSNSTTEGLGIFARNNGGNIILYAGNSAGGYVFCNLSGVLQLQTWYHIILQHTANTLWLYAVSPDGVMSYTNVVSGATTSLAAALRLGVNGAAGGNKFSDCAIAGLRMWNSSAANVYKLWAYYQSAFGNLGDAQAQGADMGARRLYLMSDQPKRQELVSNSPKLALLDCDLGDDYGTANEPEYPTADGKGALDATWSRAEARIHGLRFNGDTLKVSLDGPVLKDRNVGYLEDNGASLAPSSWNDGRMFIQPGSTRRAFGRPSVKHLEREPDGLVALVPPDVEAYNRSGVLIEGAAYNHVLYSSAFAAGWTYVTDVAHGGSVARTATLGTGYELFAQEVSAYGVKFIHGAGAGKAEQSMVPSAAITTLTVNWVLSIDWEGTAAPSYRVTRAADGWYWNDSTGAYQAGAIDNLCAGDLQRNGGYRHQSKPITKAGAGNVTPIIVYPAAIADGATCMVTHVQAEEWYDVSINFAPIDASCASSRIPTTTVAVLRQDDAVALSAPAVGDAYLLESRGTMIVLFKPQWSSVSSAGYSFVFHSDFDAAPVVNNVFEMYAVVGAAKWRARGSGWDASLLESSAPATRNTWHVLAIRWSGADLEFGFSDQSVTVFMDGISGTTAPLCVLTRPSSPTLYCSGTGIISRRPVHAYIKRTEIIPRCLSDAEIAAISTSWIAHAVAEGW
jgi:hypothetical protein